MKSLQIRIQEGGEVSFFNTQYFEEKNVNQFRRLVLRNGGNDFCHSCIQDGSFQKYLNESFLNVDFLGFQPVVLYINGNYWGIHNLREKVDRFYFESNYNVDPETVNILEGGALNVIEGQADGFLTLLNYATIHNLNEVVHYNWVADHLDIPSMVDYFIAELYINNRDWPHNNIKLWSSPENPKWRYVCYDLDVGFRYASYDLEDMQSLAHLLNNLTETNPHVALFNALLQNDEFKRGFINRYADLLNSYLASEMLIGGFRRDKDNVATEMNRHYEKWCGPISIWNERFNGLNSFINNRPKIIQDEVVQVFDLPASVELFVSTYPVNKGTVNLNSLKLTHFPFRGVYFQDNLIDLKAIPNEGEIFYYWENLRTGERIPAPNITVNPNFGDGFVAVFKATEDVFNMALSPNPVQETASLSFGIPKIGEVKILLEGIDGRLIEQLEYWQDLPKGTHRLSINIGHVPPGIYYLAIVTNYATERKKIIKL